MEIRSSSAVAVVAVKLVVAGMVAVAGVLVSFVAAGRVGIDVTMSIRCLLIH